MKYIAVRTYGNGQFMNKVWPEEYKYLSAAQQKCESLNTTDNEVGNEDKWIPFPLMEHESSDW